MALREGFFSGGANLTNGELENQINTLQSAGSASRIIYRQPGAPVPEPNAFNNSADLATAMDLVGGGGQVLLDPSHLGGAAGFDVTTNIDWKDWELRTHTLVPTTGAFLRFRVPDGVKMFNFRHFWGPLRVDFTGSGAAPIDDVADGDEFVWEGGAAWFESGGAPLCDMSSLTGIVQWRFRNSGQVGGGPAANTPVEFGAGVTCICILETGAIVGDAADPAITGGAGVLFILNTGAGGRVDPGAADVGAVIFSAGREPALGMTSLKTGTFTAVPFSVNLIDATSAVTMNLPDWDASQTGKEIEAFIAAGSSTVTIAALGGHSIIGDTSASGTPTKIFARFNGTSTWYVRAV